MDNKICVPISTEIIYEMLLRRGPETDVASWIEQIIFNYLDDTEENDGWSELYYEHLERRTGESDFKEKYGDPRKGYRWQELDMPNGTQIYMVYKREKHFASVKFEKLVYEDEAFSPSEFARKIANGTTRNAWRDLYIKYPGEKEWILADVLRSRISK